VLATTRPETRTETHRRPQLRPLGGAPDNRRFCSGLSRRNLAVPHSRDEDHQRSREVLGCGLKQVLENAHPLVGTVGNTDNAA